MLALRAVALWLCEFQASRFSYVVLASCFGCYVMSVPVGCRMLSLHGGRSIWTSENMDAKRWSLNMVLGVGCSSLALRVGSCVGWHCVMATELWLCLVVVEIRRC